jgi:hypothetical protein
MSDTQTSTVVSSPVDLTATTTDLVLVAQEPTFDEFFNHHPVKSNKKIVWLDYEWEKVTVQVKVQFSWQGGVPVYIRCTHSHDSQEQYVGVIDLFNKTIWTAPSSLYDTTHLFRVIRYFVQCFAANKLNESKFKKVSFR